MRGIWPSVFGAHRRHSKFGCFWVVRVTHARDIQQSLWKRGVTTRLLSHWNELESKDRMGRRNAPGTEEGNDSVSRKDLALGNFFLENARFGVFCGS